MLANGNFHFHAFRHIFTENFRNFANRLKEWCRARVEFHHDHLSHTCAKTGVIGN